MIEIEPEGDFVQPSPGSHLNVSVMIRERPDVRSYSIVGPCSDGVYRIAVKLLADTRGGSAYMWSLVARVEADAFGPGQPFRLGPRPAGLPAARRGHRRDADLLPRPCARRSGRAFSRGLRLQKPRRPCARATNSRASVGDRLDIVLSEEGRRVDIAAAIARLDPQGEFYVCGPIGHAGGGQAVLGGRADGPRTGCASRPSAAAADILRFRSR